VTDPEDREDDATGPDPTDDGFDRAVEAALALIPEPFASQLASVAIVAEDEPTAEQLAAVHAHGLYGLYQGVPRTAYGAGQSPVPSKITIFRGPLERRHRDPADLEAAVIETVLHEVAHHLGISDERLRELGAPASRGRR
jgi:predicted Zn-dependent protease with MMP-like domain